MFDSGTLIVLVLSDKTLDSDNSAILITLLFSDMALVSVGDSEISTISVSDVVFDSGTSIVLVLSDKTLDSDNSAILIALSFSDTALVSIGNSEMSTILAVSGVVLLAMGVP